MAGSFSKAKRTKLFKMLREGQFLATACKNAGVSRSWVYELRERDEAFAKLVDDAIADGTGVYEDELRTRILEGEPVYDRNGDIVGERKSDRLLEFALKARDRETYGDQKRTELTGPDGGPIQTSNSTSKMTPEEKKARAKKVRELLGKKDG